MTGRIGRMIGTMAVCSFPPPSLRQSIRSHLKSQPSGQSLHQVWRFVSHLDHSVTLAQVNEQLIQCLKVHEVRVFSQVFYYHEPENL